ncbi:hypothetical protein HNR03_000266 [Pseudomonas sp. JAI111]|uniref:efflux RND transporter permease subunit n=1 Tax=Pseudomonas sp. JAI111 TaxID=2735913 RepID=UPI002169C0B2|nr:MMPL family transporter [Pseudomonas sp. JAI111]MCS3835686.1 hypothetical protein [Pseudomonas sp. JAI111]
MAVSAERERQMPVVRKLEDFDFQSGNRLEGIIFNHRRWVVLLCVFTSLMLGWFASKLEINASFERMIPQSHPYIRNYFDNKDDLRGLGNMLRVVVENKNGTIYDPEFVEALKKVNDTLYLIPGVDRAWMKSVVMPVVRWTEVTEEGYANGPVLPSDYDGSARALNDFKRNVERAHVRGSLVSNDNRSTMILVPLLQEDPQTRAPLDYNQLSKILDKDIRGQFGGEASNVRIHITGFAKLVGDLMQGMLQVFVYFGLAALVTTVILLVYTRDWRSTSLVILSSVLAVVWQLGLIQILGYQLDPYSILVPFLVFAIGVSHGTQKMNGIMQDVARGTHKYVAARYTFRRLFLAGLTALVTNVIGFAVLMVIDIPVIKNLALTASLGVGTLVFTKLILVPVLLSYVGVSEEAARRSLQGESNDQAGRGFAGHFSRFVVSFTQPRRATAAVLVAAVLGGGGFIVSLGVSVGDLDPGAPELRENSIYNQDVAFINKSFGVSSDQFAVIVKTKNGFCDRYESLIEGERLTARLRQIPGVQLTSSLAETVRSAIGAGYEGDPKWQTISRNQGLIDMAVVRAVASSPELANIECTVTPIIAYLSDHKAQTLAEVVSVVEAFAREHDTEDRKFLLAAGSAGIDAVTNIVVHDANRTVLWLVYASVVLCCFLTFRDWRAVVVALIPLVITSFLCEAIMVFLGIGIKVATLPVIALGVGVGVDYALYLLSVQLKLQSRGHSLAEAYTVAVNFTGRVVCLIGFTMAAGVITWVWSPIKFQADMGLLLAFMFLWNMIGALLLIPALSYFLLRNKHPITDEALDETRVHSNLDPEPAVDSAPSKFATAMHT